VILFDDILIFIGIFSGLFEVFIRAFIACFMLFLRRKTINFKLHFFMPFAPERAGGSLPD
jgi:hypothetical protein